MRGQGSRPFFEKSRVIWDLRLIFSDFRINQDLRPICFVKCWVLGPIAGRKNRVCLPRTADNRSETPPPEKGRASRTPGTSIDSRAREADHRREVGRGTYGPRKASSQESAKHERNLSGRTTPEMDNRKPSLEDREKLNRRSQYPRPPRWRDWTPARVTDGDAPIPIEPLRDASSKGGQNQPRG